MTDLQQLIKKHTREEYYFLDGNPEERVFYTVFDSELFEKDLIEMLEGLIGEDEFESFVNYDGVPDDFGNPEAIARNRLRAEQRQAINQLKGEK